MKIKRENYRRALRRQTPRSQQLERVWGRLSANYDALPDPATEKQGSQMRVFAEQACERKAEKMEKVIFLQKRRRPWGLVATAAVLVLFLCAGFILGYGLTRQPMLPVGKSSSKVSSQPSDKTVNGGVTIPERFPAGRWVPEKKEEQFPPVICFEDAGSFTFERGMAFSYLPMGTYEVKGDEVILSFRMKEEGSLRFRWEGETMTVLETNKSFPNCTEGSVWTYFGEKTGFAWEGMFPSSLLVPRQPLQESWLPAHEKDPFYVMNPIEDEKQLPSQLPVYEERVGAVQKTEGASKESVSADAKDSYSCLLEFGFQLPSSRWQYRESYPIRSFMKARASLLKLLSVPIKHNYKILASGMSYRESVVQVGQTSYRYLVPAYDFVLQGESQEENPEWPLLRVFISVPAVSPEYLEYVGKFVDGHTEIEAEKGDVIATMVEERDDNGEVQGTS